MNIGQATRFAAAAVTRLARLEAAGRAAAAAADALRRRPVRADPADDQAGCMTYVT